MPPQTSTTAKTMSDQLSSDLAALKIDRVARPKATSSLRWLVALAAVGGGLALAYRFGLPYVEAQFFKTEVGITEISQVSPAQATVELTSSGYVVAQSVSSVSAKIGGRVTKLHVKQGDEVREGQVLFEIDPSDHKASIATAASQAAAARARVQTALANLAEAKQLADRERALAAEGLSPKANAQNAEARVAALSETVKAAQAEVTAADALVAALRVNLGNYTVVAPIGGRVTNRPPEIGEIVGPQPAGIAIDMGGVEIADFTTLMVETDVPEQRLHQVKMGGPAEIVLDAFPSRRYRGKAVEVTPKVNRAKATVTVKVAFVDEKDGVLPDMAARVSFLSGELDKEALKEPPKTIVPGGALATVNGAKVVYVVVDGAVRLTPVTLGPAFGSGFELVRGPVPGTRIVNAPPENLADGQRIKERTDG
jgi:HlyD family secretion protein